MKDGITAWLQRTVLLLCSGLVMPSFGCMFQEQIDALTAQIEKLREAQDAERRERLRLREATEMALVNATCHQDVQELLKQVASACETNAEFCELTKIPLAIMEADPTHEGRFVTMMATQRHAAIYFLKGSDDPWLNTFNQQHFASLITQRRLQSTKILIVANVDSSKKPDKKQATAENRIRLKEARARLNVVVQRLRGLRIADDNMVSMVFPFTLKKGEHLNVDDKQPPGTLDVTSSVWIFLTNCFPKSGEAVKRRSGETAVAIGTPSGLPVMKKNFLMWTSRRWLLKCLTGLTVTRWSTAARASSPSDEEVRRSERTLLHHTVTLDELQPLPGEALLGGKANVITILHLWAVECPPCVDEMPLLRKVAESFAARAELRLLLASETEDDRVLLGFITKQRGKMPAHGLYKLGPDSRLRTGLGVMNQPLTLLLDAQLVIRQAFIGTLKNRSDEFDNAVNRLALNLRHEPVSAPLQTLGRLKLPLSGLRRTEDSLLHCRYKQPEGSAGQLFVVRIYDPDDSAGAAEEQQMKARQAAFRTWEGVKFVYVRQPEFPLLTLLLDDQSIIRQVFIGPLASRANEFAEGMNWLYRSRHDKSK